MVLTVNHYHQSQLRLSRPGSHMKEEEEEKQEEEEEEEPKSCILKASCRLLMPALTEDVYTGLTFTSLCDTFE